jgi:hypothetical protein
MVLWQKFGEEILDFGQLMRMGKIGPTVHRRQPARTRRTVRRLCADGPRGPGSGTCAQQLLVWGFILTYNCFQLLILIQIYDI